MAEEATKPAVDAADKTTQANDATSMSDRIPDFADWLPESVQPYWDVVAQYPIIGAAVVALIFFILAHIVRLLVLRSIQRLTQRTATTLDDQILSLIGRPVFNTVFLVGLTLATRAALLPEGLTETVIKLLLTIIVINWLSAGFPLFGLLFQALSRNHERFPLVEERTIPLFNIIAKLTLILFGSYTLLVIWGINPVGWLASAGIVGIAVGFAAKDTLANLFSGFFILADAPYKIGDYINLDSGERGRIVSLGMRSTRLLTRDDIEITVPNAVIANAKIINESGGPHLKTRVRIAVGAAYGSDVDEVCEVLMGVAEAYDGMCADPPPRVRMRAFGASSLDFELLGWIEQPEDRGRIRHELYMAVYKAFNKAGIEIPFAKRDIYVKEMPGQRHADGERDGGEKD